MGLCCLQKVLFSALLLVTTATVGTGQTIGSDDLVIRAPDIGRGAPQAYPGRVPDDDYIWHISGLRPGDLLSMRSGAGPRFRVIAQLEEGTPVDNLGCQDQNGGFWCRVATVGHPRISGWINGRYLSDEGGGPLRYRDMDMEDYVVPGTAYYETGPLPCRFRGDDRMLGCHFGINRDGPFAQIDIAGPDGFTRSLQYRAGRFTSTDGSEVRSRKRGGAAEVTVAGEETYYIPDEVMLDF